MCHDGIEKAVLLADTSELLRSFSERVSSSMQKVSSSFDMSSSIFEPNDPILAELRSEWSKHFTEQPTIAGRAPGRVNLIGDHIDYSGFAVLPMAISGKFTTVLVAATDTGKIRFVNTDPQFPNSEVPLEPLDTIAGEGWVRYAESAVKTVIRVSQKSLTGLDCLIHNTVPISSGLSSSGALLCAITVAIDALLNAGLSPADLIKCSISAEHNIGYMTGGMDQTVTISAKKGFACLVSFNPPSIKTVKLPPVRFVVAHCGVGNSKIDNPLNQYNQRVREVTACAEMMQPGCKTIREVVMAVGPDEAMRLALALPERDGDLILRNRAVHVIQESQMVKQLCTSEFAKWSQLINASHTSLRDRFECSCDDLEALIEVGMRMGAIGARPTGSGWGGCAEFLLTPTQNVDAFIQALKKEFYEPRKIENPIAFATSPGPGAAAIKL